MRWMLVVLVACQQGAPPAPTVQTKESWGPPPPAPTIPVPPLDVPPPADPIVAVGRGLTHACAVHASGAVDCWGQARYGYNGEHPPAPDPQVHRLAATDVVGISAYANCLVHRDSHTSCFDGNTGELKRADATGIAIASDNECSVMKGGTLTCDSKVHGAVAFATAGWQSCALTNTGDVWCGSYDPFKRIPQLAHAKAIAMRAVDGEAIVCAATDDVHCWDIERDKPAEAFASFHAPGATQLSFGGARDLEARWGDPEPELTALVGDHLVSSSGVTLDHVKQLASQCAIRDTGALWCWGRNLMGVLAQPTTIGSLAAPATPVPGVSNVISISSNFSQTWAVLRDHTIVRWGIEGSDGTQPPRPYTFENELSEPWVQVVSTWVGELCARSMLGKISCRRFVHGGEYTKPLDVTDAIDMHLDSGGYLVIQRANGQTAVAQAHEMYGDTTPSRSEHIAEYIGGETSCIWEADHVDCGKQRAFDKVSQFVAGEDFICALVAGNIHCKRGVELADLPTIALSNVTEIQAAPDHVCALAAGAITCWAVGKEVTGATVIPHNAMSFEVGPGYDRLWHDNHSATDGTLDAGFSGCALMLDHTVQCWGANLDGQLFDGSFVGTTQPIPIRIP
ncbi:MAG: hypothetical protein QM831_20635 [Kofleriaceae bacterium]